MAEEVKRKMQRRRLLLSDGNHSKETYILYK
jgi:hypothetical protein